MLKAVITETAPVSPSGMVVYRPRFLIHGPWCKSTARARAKRLQSELDRNLHGYQLGWQQRTRNTEHATMSHPTGILTTKFGTVEFTMTQADHVFMKAEELVVNRVRYYCNFHCYLIDGKWQRKDCYNPYLSRKDNCLKDASSAARKAAETELAAAWTEYLAAHPDLSGEAELSKAIEIRDRLAGEVADLEEKLSAKQAELRAAERSVDRVEAEVGRC